MGTLSSLVDMSRAALLADQAALDITSNNVANQNTAGYTRQVAVWQSGDQITINGATLGSSAVSAISRRDRILEQRVQQQTQVQTQSGAIESALQQVQNVFGLTSTATSSTTTALGSAIDSFFSALSTLGTNPSSASTRQSVLSAAKTLVAAFNAAANQLGQVSSSLDQQAGTLVGNVNSLTSTIASLNQQIASLSPGKDAGSLEDQRQLALAQLSQYVGFNKISTEGNSITLTTSSGALLVSGSQSYAMSTAQVAGTSHVLAGPNGEDVTTSLTGGALGGTLQVRDQELPVFSNVLDNLAYAIGTQVNQLNAQGVDGNGAPGLALFTLPASQSGAASTIQMATTDPQAIAAAAAGEGASGNGNALAMADLASANNVGGQTATSFFSSLLGQIGSAASGASTDNAAQQATLAQLTTQRNALSGVSLDEEAANLTQYQRSYQAAAKVFSVVDSIMASALNLGEASTVS
jgi:flagellar hook-associated protein 1 FlgK